MHYIYGNASHTNKYNTVQNWNFVDKIPLLLIKTWWLTRKRTTSHVFVNKYNLTEAESPIYTDIGMSMHPHTPNNYKHTRTQPQLFCYFPLQHLVLISFLMRLRLRPIRADYQRRSGVGCMPTMTPVPRERPGWKRPQQYAHTYACRSTHRHTSLQFFPKQKYEPHIGFCEYYCTL